jgi:CHAT domain-containing protein
MNLNLDKTELVVLSACETGLGEIQNGEGVFGLRRAFQQAGARTVLMSLWRVNDEATQELMTRFYRNWITGITKREAFIQAQKEVKDIFPAPYYWGAFVMVGE